MDEPLFDTARDSAEFTTGEGRMRVAGGRLQPAAPESAAYIADLATEMARMARGSGLEVLAYLLDIARLEAETTLRRLSQERIAR